MSHRKLKGMITISKPQGPDGKRITIEITDNNSHIAFIEVDMSLEDFADAVTGLGYVRVDMEVRNLANVGKIKEQKELVFPLKDGIYRSKSEAEKNCQNFADPGWTADGHFSSQNSIRSHSDGKYYAHGSQFRFVDPPKEGLKPKSK